MSAIGDVRSGAFVPGKPAPCHAPAQAKLIDLRCVVVRDPRRQDIVLPRRRGSS